MTHANTMKAAEKCELATVGRKKREQFSSFMRKEGSGVRIQKCEFGDRVWVGGIFGVAQPPENIAGGPRMGNG